MFVGGLAWPQAAELEPQHCCVGVPNLFRGFGRVLSHDIGLTDQYLSRILDEDALTHFSRSLAAIRFC